MALLDRLRPQWAGRGRRPDTSMFTMLFARPDETGYNFTEQVEVIWQSHATPVTSVHLIAPCGVRGDLT